MSILNMIFYMGTLKLGVTSVRAWLAALEEHSKVYDAYERELLECAARSTERVRLYGMIITDRKWPFS